MIGSFINCFVSQATGSLKTTQIKYSFKAGFHWRRSRSRSRSRKSASDLAKIQNRSRKRSHKLDRIGVRRIRTVPFSSDSAYDSDAYDLVKTRLSESQAEAQETINHNACRVYSSAAAYDSDNLVFTGS